MDLNNSEPVPVMVDQVMIGQAQVEELNQALSDALQRSSQHRALAMYFEGECKRLQNELSEARTLLEETKALLEDLRSESK